MCFSSCRLLVILVYVLFMSILTVLYNINNNLFPVFRRKLVAAGISHGDFCQHQACCPTKSSGSSVRFWPLFIGWNVKKTHLPYLLVTALYKPCRDDDTLIPRSIVQDLSIHIVGRRQDTKQSDLPRRQYRQ